MAWEITSSPTMLTTRSMRSSSIRVVVAPGLVAAERPPLAASGCSAGAAGAARRGRSRAGRQRSGSLLRRDRRGVGDLGNLGNLDDLDDLGGRRGVGFHDLEIAVADHEFEHLVDLRARRRGLQRAGPPDIGSVRLHLGQRGHLAGLRHQFELTQLAQLADKIERLVRLLQHFGFRPERDGVGAHGVGGARIVVEIDRNRLEIEPVKFRRRRAVVVLGRGGAPFVAIDDLLKRGANFVAETGGDRLAGARHLHQIGQYVACRQQHVERVGCGLQAAAPDAVEQSLEHMREADQRFETENTGTALDRMHTAKHRIDGVVGLLAFANIGQASFDLLQGFVAFVKKRLL